METGAGFYKNDTGTLLYGPQRIDNKNYTLLAADHAAYTTPTDGWFWYETRAAALAAYGITDPEIPNPESLRVPGVLHI